jgi:hypothetical protein
VVGGGVRKLEEATYTILAELEEWGERTYMNCTCQPQ